MRLRIGILAIAGVALVTAAVIGVMSVLILRAHRGALVAQLTRSADQLSETIARSTYVDMLENRRDALHREILTIGAQKGIEKVRLFNATGTIMFSSDEAEIGRSVDQRAEACYACHAADQPLQRLSMRERSRIYRGAEGRRVLGMIRPIHNETACSNAGCHAHSRSDAVLGVLDVNLSLAEADREIARDQRWLLLLVVLAVAASSMLLWWLNDRLVLRPVATLIAGTRKVAEGDLRTTIPAASRHELGDLARAFNDMTRRLGEAQRQLTQADKLASVGRLAAGVAHEINNPLTGVLTYASFLLKRSARDPEMQKDLEVIVRETKRCRDIVRGLLDFARPAPPQRQPTDLNEVVRRGAAVVMNQLALGRISLAFDLASDLEPLPADSNQIQQVVVNLLINAADAIGEAGGTIRVGTRAVPGPALGHDGLRAASLPKGCIPPDPGVIGGSRANAAAPQSPAAALDSLGAQTFVELTIEDTGRGIPPEHLDRLFEPFFTTKGSRGTGLGLAVSWGIVEAHGGSIDVESEPGKGARFTLRLPYASAMPPVAGRPPASAESERGAA